MKTYVIPEAMLAAAYRAVNDTPVDGGVVAATVEAVILWQAENPTAWLIEADGSYWDGKFADSRGFTRSINDALRFSRFQDAETVKHWLLQAHSFALRTTQHAWINGMQVGK